MNALMKKKPDSAASGAMMPSGKALVPFVSVQNMMNIVHQVGLDQMLRALADYIQADFLRWEEFDKIARVAAHSDIGAIELMPTADASHYGFKYVNAHPANMAQGLQTVAAFGGLARVDTGYPLLLSEMSILTAIRTAAMSGMVARKLAPENARTMALIGNGAQSEFQAYAFRELVGITTLRLYDIDPGATRKAVANLANSGLTLEVCRSAEEAVEGAEIITTCTADKKMATILSDNMVGPGVHLNAIGGDCPGKTELHPDILLRGRIFVEYPPQTRVEGDIQQLPSDHPVTEMWRVLAGTAEGRTSRDQITIFDGVGFAIEDFSALRYVLDLARQTGFYEDLDMIADPDDPRDLFGMVHRHHLASSNAV